MIFSFLRQKKANQQIVARQYQVLTEAARMPIFYSDMDVPDTVMGRFEMLCVQLVLYFRHSRNAGDRARLIAQEMIEAFFEDLDHSIRELGIGDMGVPKRMKKFTRMFYGRATSYEEALNAADRDAMAAALRRNIYPEADESAPAMAALADYAFATDAALAGVMPEAFEEGTVVWPQIEGAKA